MIIVIPIREIWQRFDEQSAGLKNLGVTVELAVQTAFGFAVQSAQGQAMQSPQSAVSFEMLVLHLLRLLNDQLPSNGQLVYDRNSPQLHHLVDVIGEISYMLADTVIRQLGQFPLTLRLERFTGPDLVLSLDDEDNRESVHRSFSDRRAPRYQRTHRTTGAAASGLSGSAPIGPKQLGRSG